MATVFTLAGAFAAGPSYLNTCLRGTITNGNTVVPINYPNWTIFEAQVDTGAQMLNDAITSTSGMKIAFGHSLGAVVISNWLRNYGPTCTVSADELVFILIGNSVRLYGGELSAQGLGFFFPNSYPIPADTPYTVTDFARQYDGFADIPQFTGDATQNTEAFLNSISGEGGVHPYYYNVALTDPGNVSYTPVVDGAPGNVTYMWSPTWPVPALGSTQNMTTLALDALLRPGIEAAYSRPVDIPAPGLLMLAGGAMPAPMVAIHLSPPLLAGAASVLHPALPGMPVTIPAGLYASSTMPLPVLAVVLGPTPAAGAGSLPLPALTIELKTPLLQSVSDMPTPLLGPGLILGPDIPALQAFATMPIPKLRGIPTGASMAPPTPRLSFTVPLSEAVAFMPVPALGPGLVHTITSPPFASAASVPTAGLVITFSALASAAASMPVPTLAIVIGALLSAMASVPVPSLHAVVEITPTSRPFAAVVDMPVPALV